MGSPCAKFYEAELGIKCERTVPTTQTVCRISTDEHVFLNASPMPMILQQPHEGVEKRVKSEIRYQMKKTSYNAGRESGVIPFYEKQHMRKGVFWRLKDTAHHLFRNSPGIEAMTFFAPIRLASIADIIFASSSLVTAMKRST